MAIDLDDPNSPKISTRLYPAEDPAEKFVYWYLADVLGRRWLTSEAAIAWASANGYEVLAIEAIEEITRSYGTCSITGPKEDVLYIFKHLPDVDDES